MEAHEAFTIVRKIMAEKTRARYATDEAFREYRRVIAAQAYARRIRKRIEAGDLPREWGGRKTRYQFLGDVYALTPSGAEASIAEASVP